MFFFLHAMEGGSDMEGGSAIRRVAFALVITSVRLLLQELVKYATDAQLAPSATRELTIVTSLGLGTKGHPILGAVLPE
jgi:hypothetical protein